MCLTDGFWVTFFGRWRGAVHIHMSHVQLTCGIIVHITTIWWRGALTCGSRVAIHVWQLMCTLLLYGGREPSCVAHMWQLTYMVINMHVTTIWWRGALTSGN